MKGFHKHQLSILQKLMYANGLTYSKIKPKSMEGSLFTFHLEQLIKAGFVKKQNSKYLLTKTGKELAGRMDLGDTIIQTQAKVSVIMACKKKTKGEEKFLLYTRHKSPFYNYQGFPTGKVKRGEDIINAAKRELGEETGLTGGSPEIFSILHYKIYDNDKSLLEDKIFFAFRFTNPRGKITSGPEGNYKWVGKKDIWNYLKRPVKEIKKLVENIDSAEVKFFEGSYITGDF